MATIEDFNKLDIRAGRIADVKDFPEAKKPAYKLWVDLCSEIGIKKASAQITRLYKKEELIGRQVNCVINFYPRQVANFVSEVLTTGFVLESGIVVLAQPERDDKEGTRLY